MSARAEGMREEKKIGAARGRRKLRWMILAGALGVVIWLIYRVIQRLAAAGPDFAANHLVLPILVVAIVILALALAGVLVRNLVRLILDRKRGILGSKLRTKLVFFFLAFVVFPASVLFYGSAAVIRLTVEAMLKTPVEDVTRGAREIANGWTEAMTMQCVRLSDQLASDLRRERLLEVSHRAELEDLLRRWLGRDPIDLVAVSEGTQPAMLAVDPQLAAVGGAVDRLRALSEALAAEARRKQETATRVDPVAGGLFVQSATPIAGGPWPATSSQATIVVVGTYLPRHVAEQMAQITSGAAIYRRFLMQRRDTIRLYRALIILILLVTVFVATWIGFYLSRRITVPIEELAAAAREISTGNLGVRVRAEAGDEVGVLVDAFNEMAAQLQESREVITRSTADLRRTNQALDDRRRYIETLVANLSTAVISLDHGGRVAMANPAAERMLGIPLRPGDDLTSGLESPGLEPLRDLLGSAEREIEGASRRDVTLSPRGEVLSVAVQVTPLRAGQGEGPGTLVMIEDLSDLLRAQRAAAWREVARRIAHEIKNPLTPIQLAAQRIRKKFQEGAPDLPEVLPEATASIEHEVAALKGLVDEFSRFARMPEVSPRPVEMREIVDSVLSLFQGLHGVKWEVDLEPGMGKVRVDAEQMRRALINLVDNAVAAMNGSGTIRIAARSRAGPGSMELEVADTGPGIPYPDRDKLFLPYFSTKRRGTGLGLAIVHRVVTDHRGTIRVEDNEPRGARFVIEIPA